MSFVVLARSSMFSSSVSMSMTIFGAVPLTLLLVLLIIPVSTATGDSCGSGILILVLPSALSYGSILLRTSSEVDVAMLVSGLGVVGLPVTSTSREVFSTGEMF